MKIEELKTVDNVVLDDLNCLMRQLSVDIRLLTDVQLKKVVDCTHIHLFVVKDGERIIGALTLVENNLLSGYKASIEDVVVADSYRGEGIGRLPLQYAVDFAEKTGVEKIDLTSRPGRLAANELYKKIGFVLRDTNVYRYCPVENTQ